MKKKIVIITVVLLLLVSAFFIGKKLIWNYKVAHAEKIVELVRDEVLVYDNIRIKKLIKNINGTLTTNPKIDTSKLGSQTVKFNYTTDEGYPVSYEVEIKVVDVTLPMIFQVKNKTIYTGYEGDLAKDLFCGDNYDPNPKCYIKGEYDVNTPGNYEITFIGEDSSGNKATNNFTLTVKEKPKSSRGGGSYDYTDFNEIKDNYKKPGVQLGIDVSHWQGDIDFQKVKEAGVEFAYIRVGRGDGIGQDYVLDDKFEQNIKGFNQVGIPVGIYFYSNANSKKDAEKEAKWILKQIKKYNVELEIVFDWENWSDFQYYDLSFYGLNETKKAFIDTVEEKGYKGMLYSSKSYLETIWTSNKDVWLAHYTKETNYTGSYKVWQLCDDGKIEGIDGYVDLDLRYT
ncbi:MAG: hypothetical protein IKF71_02160 [Bacilli bacterium]|nr:hypothetical protein [Bacilli bacterium]